MRRGNVAQGFEEAAKKLSDDYKVVKAKYDEDNPKVCDMYGAVCQSGGGLARERRRSRRGLC